MPASEGKKVIDYTVLKVSGVDKLTAAVNAKIKEGWIPQGGIQTVITSGFTLTEMCYQAMVKYE